MNLNVKINNIFELIEFIQKRPGMYIGNNTITSMETFLNGYIFASDINNLNLDIYPKFWYFHEWVKEHYNWFESTAGWKNIILAESNNDEEKALNVFFELIAKFKEIKPISVKYIYLENENITFYLSELLKESKSNQFSLPPLYKNAEKVILVEHSQNFGISVFITSQQEILGLDWRERFKSTQKAINFINKLFNINRKFKKVENINLVEYINNNCR